MSSDANIDHFSFLFLFFNILAETSLYFDV